LILNLNKLLKMAERTGLEPATSGVTGQHSNQLNYRSAKAARLFSIHFFKARTFREKVI
jgi:hypothetical protein